MLSSFGMFHDRVYSLVKDYKKRNTGRNVHNEVLTRVMDAPINLFFDITPIGLIINRIRSDIMPFRRGLMEIPGHMCDMCSHFLYIAILFLTMNSPGTFMFFCAVMYCIFLVGIPMLEVRKSVDRIGHTIHSPIDSYFHETMRGVSVIRAFNQSESVI
jgi:ABC-type multidrug transport system fused ATPase/permease subunit